MSVNKFADIVVPVPLNKNFTYSISVDQSKNVSRGHRVLINFGKNKLYTGIVHDIHDNPPEYDVKDIIEAPDKKPLVVEQQLALWKWMSEYYCCSLGEVMKAALPSNLVPSSESEFYFNFENHHTGNLSEYESRIINYLRNAKVANLSKISDATGIKYPIKQLQQLQQKGIVNINQQLEKKYKPVFKTVVEFYDKFLDNNIEVYENLGKRAARQKEILDFLVSEATNSGNGFVKIDAKDLMDRFGTGKPSLDSLMSKGLIKYSQKEVSRFDFDDACALDSPKLSDAQQLAYDSIKLGLNEKRPVLLHGVTSSGKTEIYIKIIEQVIAEGKQALYMLPEIALTSQMIRRLRRHFGNRIGVYHSKYSINNRSEVYQSLISHKYDVILGVRSSIFLPFDNLGLIIVDEEHENSYKQQNPDPRYNARDMAIVLKGIHKCSVLLGSATPSIESYYNAETGKYKLVELNERYGNVALPKIEIVDIKDAYRRRIMRSYFHPVLVDEVQNALTNGEQIVLFQNRRGYSPYLECKDCGWVPYCDSCNVSLTYHKYGNMLVCHYCGQKSHVVTKCGSCGSSNITNKGLGTERIVDEIQEIFPEARVARLDYDTAASRKRFEKILSDFENHKTDILVGTQMVTKGLDFEKLRLIGILNADNMLNFPDFRAFERSYQLLAQVSGRAGRREKQGKVIIQTYTPEHPILHQVLENDYRSMYKDQVSERSLFRYPPSWSFIIIKLKNRDKEKLHKAAATLATMLRKDLYQRVLGPEEPLINRINKLYILNIHIRFEKKLSSVKIKKLIVQSLNYMKQQPEIKSTTFEIDVDPL